MIEVLIAEAMPALLSIRATPFVSLIVPAEHSPRGADAARLELKNLLGAARDELEVSLSPREADAVLAPAERLLVDEPFWHEVTGGLVIYLAGDQTIVRRVETVVEPAWLVADRPLVAPVLHTLLPEAAFHVLALSRNHTQVFAGRRHSLEAIHVPDLPKSLEDALWFEQYVNLLHRHGGTYVGSGRHGSVSHATGSERDDRHERDSRYFRILDDAIVAALAKTGTPLVVAAVEREIAGYLAVTKYPHVLPRGIEGNPDRLSVQDLHDSAWQVVEETLRQRRGLILDRYHEFDGTGRTSTDPAHIAELASTGGIDCLFVLPGAHRSVDPDGTGHDAHCVGDRELVNNAVIDTLATGGTVEPLDNLSEVVGSEDAIVAALLRRS